MNAITVFCNAPEDNPLCSVGLEAIGMVNSWTTAVRVIPVPGKKAGEWAEFGGLLDGAPIKPVNSLSRDAFIARCGRIPAPIHSFRN